MTTIPTAEPPLTTDLLADAFGYPFEPPEGSKRLLVGSAIYAAGMIIPLIPMLFAMGYAARMARRVIHEGFPPHMDAWDDWNGFLLDGLRLWGVSMVFMLPGYIFVMGGVAVQLFATFMTMGEMERSNGSGMPAFFITWGIVILLFLIGMVLIWVTGFFAVPAQMHALANRSFKAGFDVTGWWRIFRANLSGFVLAYLAAAAIGVVLTLAMQVLMIPMFFCPLLPALLMVAVLFYVMLVTYALYARAYRIGLARLGAGPAGSRSNLE